MKLIRKVINKSPEEIAAQLKMSSVTIRAIEAGRRNGRGITISKLLDYYLEYVIDNSDRGKLYE